MTGGVRIGPQARQRRPPRELHFRAASINLLNLALSLAAIVLTLVVGLVLSGLLDVDPSRDYGLLSPIARALQALLASFAGGRY